MVHNSCARALKRRLLICGKKIWVRDYLKFRFSHLIDDISALNAKLVQETKTKDEQEKKIRTLEDSVKELNNKLDASNKTKENEEALKNKFAIELSKLKGTYEKQIAELETTLAAERENARYCFRQLYLLNLMCFLQDRKR